MTHDRTIGRPDLDALEELLATYGADRTRWPAPERLRFAPLISAEPAARKLLREAEMLDQLLDSAPVYAGELPRLADRIVAAAVLDQRKAPATATGLGRASGAARRARSYWRGLGSDGNWMAGAMLAASLVAGAFIGTTGVVAPVAQSVTVAADDGDEFQGSLARLTLGSYNTAEELEEDLL